MQASKERDDLCFSEEIIFFKKFNRKLMGEVDECGSLVDGENRVKGVVWCCCGSVRLSVVWVAGGGGRGTSQG